MNNENIKCVIVIDKELPLGLIANTAAILGCSLSNCIDDIIGPDVSDMDGFIHKGIINIPLPILSSSREGIQKIHNVITEKHNDKIVIIDFNEVAQKCNIYDEYKSKLSNAAYSDLNYLGLCIYGDKKTVNSITGSLPSLR